MGPVEVKGLPAHVLLVHLVVVLVPLAVACLLLSVFWPAARRRLGIVTPLLALAALITVPITTHAGEWLEARVGATPLVAKHAELGDELLPWAIGLFIIAALTWFWFRWSTRTTPTGSSDNADGAAPESAAPALGAGARTIGFVVVAVLALVVSVGSVIQVYRIGDSGARASWTGSFTEQPKSQK